MVTSFIVFIFYIIFLFFSKERAYYYIYNIGVLLFGVFLCTKVEPSSISFVYHVIAIGMLLPIIPYLKKYLPFFVASIFVLFAYILIKFIGWHIDIIRMFMDLRISIFAVCLCLAMIEDIRRGRLNMRLLVKGLYILVLLQLVLAVFQYLFPSTGNFFVVVNADSGMDAADKAMKFGMNLLTGTLMTPSALAGFLDVLMFVLLVYELENRSMTFRKAIFLLMAVGIAFLTGIRTPFIFFVLFSTIYLFSYKRKLFFSFLPAFIVLSLIVVTTATVSQIGAVGRMLEGFTQMSSGMEGLEETTLGLSFLMIPYFIDNPLFGVSLGAGGYNIIGLYTLEDMSITDVYLIYILCEYGLIGLFFFLYPFFRINRLSSKAIHSSLILVKQSTVLLFVAYGVCLAIVDKGIFNYLTIVLLVTGIVLFSYNTRDLTDAPQKSISHLNKSKK